MVSTKKNSFFFSIDLFYSWKKIDRCVRSALLNSTVRASVECQIGRLQRKSTDFDLIIELLNLFLSFAEWN